MHACIDCEVLDANMIKWASRDWSSIVPMRVSVGENERDVWMQDWANNGELLYVWLMCDVQSAIPNSNEPVRMEALRGHTWYRPLHLTLKV